MTQGKKLQNSKWKKSKFLINTWREHKTYPCELWIHLKPTCIVGLVNSSSVSPTVSLGLEIFSTVRAGEKRTMNTLDVKIEAGSPKEIESSFTLIITFLLFSWKGNLEGC